MMRFVAATCILISNGSLAWACWAALDPHGFAEECLIIVTGTIESVVEAKPGGERDDDIANIRIEKIHRNELKDVGLSVGDLLRVRMISKNNHMRTSTDLNYPVKTRAVWLIVLNTKGQFRIDRHPVQKQPLNFEPNRRGEVKLRKARGPEDEPDNTQNPAGSKTTAEWVAWQKQIETERARELAAYHARQKAMRELADAFAKPDGMNDKNWNRYLELDADTRSSFVQMDIHEQPMSGVRFAEFVQGVLSREKVENIRTHAVCRLGYSRDPGAKGAETLAAALGDPSASVRMFACQSIGQRKFIQLTQQVKQLQNDVDPAVREMATHTLEAWRKSAVK